VSVNTVIRAPPEEMSRTWQGRGASPSQKSIAPT
jgi:hypothetical protein